MTVPNKLLIEGENVVLSVRTHVKALLLPALLLVVVAGVAGYLTALVGDRDVPDWVLIAIWVVAAVVISIWVVIPFLRWITTSYTITSRRVLFTTGIITRTGRAIPLSRINDVQFEKGLVDRLLGCGTLKISEASEQSGLQLHDVPQVESVHRLLTSLVFGRADGRDDDGSPPMGPGAPSPR